MWREGTRSASWHQAIITPAACCWMAALSVGVRGRVWGRRPERGGVVLSRLGAEAREGGRDLPSFSLAVLTCSPPPGALAIVAGQNGNGRLGTGFPPLSVIVPTTVLGGLSFSSLVAGQYHTCGLLTSDSSAWCFGKKKGCKDALSPPRRSCNGRTSAERVSIRNLQGGIQPELSGTEP